MTNIISLMSSAKKLGNLSQPNWKECFQTQVKYAVSLSYAPQLSGYMFVTDEPDHPDSDGDVPMDLSPVHQTANVSDQFSLDRLDFNNAIELDLQVSVTPMEIPSLYSEPFNAFPLLYTQWVTINPAAMGFNSGDIVYIRTYVQDSDHNEPTEIPEYQTSYFLKNYFAFYVN